MNRQCKRKLPKQESPHLKVLNFIQNHHKRHPRQPWPTVHAYDQISQQIRTKCGPKKRPNILQTLTSRQLGPTSCYDPHYNNHQDDLRNSLCSNFANRIQPFTNTLSAQASGVHNFSNPYKKHFIFQPDYHTGGLSLDTVAQLSPWEDYCIQLRARLQPIDQNNQQQLQLEFDGLKFGPRLRPLQLKTGHVFVHKDAFSDTKFKNILNSSNYNVPVFFKHISGILRHVDPTKLLLRSTMYCQRESQNRLRNGRLHHQKTFLEVHNLTDEPFFRDGSANRPFEDYYAKIYNNSSSSYKWEQDGDGEQRIWNCEKSMILEAQTSPTEQTIPVDSYTAIHWHLIRTFYCENMAILRSSTKYVRLLNNVSLESYHIRYHEPGYHRYPIPNASICGYSNGKLRLGSYDRRCNPMQREINIHDQSIRAVKFHPKNDLQFLVSGDGNFLRLYDVRMLALDGKVQTPVLDYNQHRSTHHYHQIVLDPTTNLLVSSGCDNMVRFWNSSTGKLERCFDPLYDVRPEVALPVQAFYSGDFRYEKDCSPRSEVLFTSYGGDFRMFTSKIYNSADSE